MTGAKKSKIEWLKLNGRNMTIDKTEDTKHFETGSVLQSKNGNQFKLTDCEDFYEVVPVTKKVDSDNVYLLVGRCRLNLANRLLV